MLKFIYAVAGIHLALCSCYLLAGLTALDYSEVSGGASAVGHSATLVLRGDGGAWFQRIKPYCNPVEVEVRVRSIPPPDTLQGTGYKAACYALAGKIDQARTTLQTLAPDQQGNAAGIVFEVGHPVADAGDDLAAGPIMRLVIEFWPNNYQALYHAGMSEYALGDPKNARIHLTQFLEIYTAQDGWRTNATTVLAQMAAGGGSP